MMMYDVEARCHVLICHLYNFLSEGTLKIFGLFLKWVVFLLLSFKSSLSVLDYSPLSDVSLANFFFYSVASLYFLQTDVFNFNEVQLINYFFYGIMSKKELPYPNSYILSFLIFSVVL